MNRALCVAAFFALFAAAYAQSPWGSTTGPHVTKAGVLTDENNFSDDVNMVVDPGLCTAEQFGAFMLTRTFSDALLLPLNYPGLLARSTSIRLSWVYTIATYDNKGHATTETKPALVLAMPKKGLLSIDPNFYKSVPGDGVLDLRGQYCATQGYPYLSSGMLALVWRILRANGATLSYDPRFVPLALPGAKQIQ